MPKATTISNSPEETLALGEAWAAEARAGWVIGLEGDLGAGKTQLVKGLARGLGIAEPTTSPTFTLVSEYEGKLPLAHLDFYRLEYDEQILAAGLEPYFSPEGIAVIEWINRWTGPRPDDYRHVTLTQTGETERRIEHEDSRA
ncbi:MAG TPA: tRNA (adenosine(37)-N6)-threonylcarbamoyltransferase complex ATPase subunit type 1 TsaE [Verrucomicrobiales bacterium]|nr:tRNA (adenosine(37)-N6)-threonylcarbamoyltransferase complex ATPase subunit type 1 TsaE [Verrucomicrobiales bacterium]|tara:strand:- start:848 stop:1276 length:429 start_codon:yes stop_codon:yes gene_type:complete